MCGRTPTTSSPASSRATGSTTGITRRPATSSRCTWTRYIPADIGYRLAAAYNFPVVRSIAEALTLGTGKLAVDGVLLVAEHGNYPFNDKQQQLYPRFKFFQQVVDIFRQLRAGGSGLLRQASVMELG